LQLLIIYIYNVRFYKGGYFINNNKHKASYKDLLKFIDSFYNIKQRSLAYSLDTLCPGLYIWFFNTYIILGGDICPANYNYVIPTKLGFGFVFPSLDHWHTPFKQFKKNMTLEELLKYNNPLDGLEAIYKEYNLLGVEEENDPNAPNISQEEKELRQQNLIMKKKYGWAFSDLWNLDDVIFKFILPRLYVFYKEDVEGRQDVYLDEGSWADIVKDILRMILLNLEHDGSGFTPKESMIHINGMTLLARYIRRLWI